MPSEDRSHAEQPTHQRPGKSPEALRIWLLGGFKVSVGSRAIPREAWRLRKASALVKLLALAPGHRLHREQIMTFLWPDSGRTAASNSLRGALYTARKVLDSNAGPLYLASEEESLVLCRGGDPWVDVDAFEGAVAAGRRSRDPAAYRAAVELYSGELLPEDRYEDWAEKRRQELRAEFLSVLFELAGLYEERGDYGRGVETLRRVLSVEPTAEEAHARLMRLHAYSGRQQEALSQYEQLERFLSEQFGTRPDVATRRLRDEIAAGGSFSSQPLPTGSPQEEDKGASGLGRHNLIQPGTSFVGREREMIEVKRSLSTTRLTTLTGAGGSGKTRLALEVTRDLASSYADGVRLIELAPLSEPELVVQEVAGALQAQEQPGGLLLESLLGTLGEREMLLVLDNCEHLLDAVARLATAILDSCTDVRLLATSREPLGVTGELTWLVPPLSAPGAAEPVTVEELEGYESARLFADRASKRHPGFELTPANAPAVARVCSRLEGIPLAIELAAARVGMLSAGQISARLDHSLSLLTGGEQTSDQRHGSLRAALDWGYGMLGEAEKALFERLSVFAGGFTLEAAERVGARGGIEEEDVPELLTALVDKSLVVAEESWEHGARYKLLEPVRQHAQQKLEASGDAGVVRGRHAEFFLSLVEAAEPELKGARQAEWLDLLETEHDNLRAALSFSLGREIDLGPLGPRMAGALCLFWYTRGYLSEGRTYLEAAAGSDEVPATVRAKALMGLGWIAEPQGDYERARLAYQEGLELYRKSDDKRGVANALGDLGSLLLDRGDYEQATSLLEESLTLHRELGSREDVVGVLDGLGILASTRGDLERSISLFSEALALSRATGNLRRTAAALGNLGVTVLVHGEHEQASVLLDESLDLFREIGDDSNIAIGLMYSALVALTRGDHGRARALGEESLKLLQKAEDKQHIADCLEIMAGAAGAQARAHRAARLWGMAESLREEMGVRLQPEDRKLLDPYLTAARSRLSEVAWLLALAEGRAMTPEQAIEYALTEEEPGSRPSVVRHSGSAASSPLTPREEEVAVLVSRGLTNRRIASELSISEHTAATHIARILKRLGLNSRSRLSAWVAERGLPSSEQGDSRRY